MDFLIAAVEVGGVDPIGHHGCKRCFPSERRQYPDGPLRPHRDGLRAEMLQPGADKVSGEHEQWIHNDIGNVKASIASQTVELPLMKPMPISSATPWSRKRFLAVLHQR